MVNQYSNCTVEYLKLTISSNVALEDPKVSNKHLRIYSIVYENGKSITIHPLVYAEDLSRNGTFWNGSLIGRGNGGFLLSNGDTLRVGANSLFEYVDNISDEKSGAFDLLQESEMKVLIPSL